MPRYDGVSCETCGWLSDGTCHCSHGLYSAPPDPAAVWCDHWRSRGWVAAEMDLRRRAGDRCERIARGEVTQGEL